MHLQQFMDMIANKCSTIVGLAYHMKFGQGMLQGLDTWLILVVKLLYQVIFCYGNISCLQ